VLFKSKFFSPVVFTRLRPAGSGTGDVPVSLSKNAPWDFMNFWFLLCSQGINIFLDGFVPTENLRFRETSLVFKVSETANEEEIKRMCRYEYPQMEKNLGIFIRQ